jgi:hypothetical protein
MKEGYHLMEHEEYEELKEYVRHEDHKEYNEHGIPIPKPVVSIPEDAFQNRLGRLFVGRTELLTFGHECYAWGGLINPSDSGVDLFIDTFTISNFTATPFVGQIWFNTTPPAGAHVSKNVSSGNTALRPLPMPRVKLEYASCVEEKIRGGVNPFLRIVAPYSTLVAEQFGRQIIPPGGTFVIILKPIEESCRRLAAKIVFAWWEEKTRCPSGNYFEHSED